MDPFQAQHYVGTDLGPNCLQRLLADGTGMYQVKLTLANSVDQRCMPQLLHCFRSEIKDKIFQKLAEEYLYYLSISLCFLSTAI